MTGARGIEPEHQHGSGYRRQMVGAAMQRQGRPAADVARARKLAGRPLGEARPEGFRREHLVLPLAAVVPLRAVRDF